MITVTWNDGLTDPEVFNVPDPVASSLDQFRLRQTRITEVPVVDPAPGAATTEFLAVPIYPSIKDMLIGLFMQSLVQPAIAMFPPPEIVALRQQAEVAQQALAAAQAASFPGFSAA